MEIQNLSFRFSDEKIAKTAVSLRLGAVRKEIESIETQVRGEVKRDCVPEYGV